ncbi:hypothetical protein [Paenirhodobacter populi]|uniref:Uncharacterized protein n=1 Tax=Paenirhodobacter populi TaxID=2306993 RepID=A0A443J1I1_9RHOB|nr:hypothetical protein [Sinirhodobacter populi]RWR14235.1 hypothetical protein D2T33_03185 [Sinirhodobacter populi]
MTLFFTPDEIDECRAAMMKPAPIGALALIASGRAVVELSDDRRNVYLDELDGRKMRDRGHKLSISGAWPLYRAGMIDDSCRVTDAGRKLLAAVEGGV